MVRCMPGYYMTRFVPVCDGCGKELPEEYDFEDAVCEMRAENWRIVPPNEDFNYWSHYCPACAAASDFG